MHTAVIKENIAEQILFGLRDINVKGLFKVGDLIDLVYLFSSMIKGDYQIDIKTLGMTILGILYVVIPTDFIPDFLGPIGFADDIAVIQLVAMYVENELKNYRKTNAYKVNLEHGIDINYLFPRELFTDFFNKDEFKEVKNTFKTLLPSEGSINVEETSLVMYNETKDYNKKGYQQETIDFFGQQKEIIIYLFNNILSNEKGKCSITADDILNRVILPSNDTKEVVKEILDNADQYYNHEIFTNFKKSVYTKLSKMYYEFDYEVIGLQDLIFTMDNPIIDRYNDTDFNVYNVKYKSDARIIDAFCMYELIELVKKAKNQNKFRVNYLFALTDYESQYIINYNSLTNSVRVSTFNSKDLFFERDLEKLLNTKIK